MTKCIRCGEMNPAEIHTCTPQPESLRLAEFLETYESFPKLSKAAAELRRLHEVEKAHLQWLEKTEWVQDTAKPHELGQHRADVMRQRIDLLHEVNAELVKALKESTRLVDDALAAFGDCDHEVGICNCDMKNSIKKSNETLAKAQGEKE